MYKTDNWKAALTKRFSAFSFLIDGNIDYRIRSRSARLFNSLSILDTIFASAILNRPETNIAYLAMVILRIKKVYEHIITKPVVQCLFSVCSTEDET